MEQPVESTEGEPQVDSWSLQSRHGEHPRGSLRGSGTPTDVSGQPDVLGQHNVNTTVNDDWIRNVNTTVNDDWIRYDRIVELMSTDDETARWKKYMEAAFSLQSGRVATGRKAV